MKRTHPSIALRSIVGLLALTAASGAMNGQTVTLFGALSNFDVLNDTGQDAHGFEVELQGFPSNVTPYSFGSTRYGGSNTIPIAGGVVVRWASAYDAVAHQFAVATTVPATFQPTFGHSCVSTFIVGCDHYGVVVPYPLPQPTSVSYYWLVEDATNPGQLVRFSGPKVQIPQPTVSILPAQPGLPAQVVFQIQAEPPPPPPIPKPVPQFGDAKWVKVYKTELLREVVLEELVADNPIVPQDPGLAETAWKLLQFNPRSNGNSGVLRNQGGLGNGSRSVLRRYEFYKFTGTYDPIDHKAICADVICSVPAPTEVGNFIGAQNAAANVGVPSITVTVSGDGQVSSSNNAIRCPGTCSMTADAGASVTLTAKNGKGTFTGWTGACAAAGISLTCTTTVNQATATTATFLTPFKLTLSTTGLGSVTTDPAGTTFLSGSIVTLTATPSAGQTFTGWAGACAGTSLTCTLTMNANASVTAAFTGVVAPPPPPPPPPSASFKLVVKLNGKGQVTSNPAGSSFAAGTVVTLTAAPGSGTPFVGWAGGCTGSSLTCSVTISADTQVIANFR